RQLCYGTMRDFQQLNIIANTLLKRPFKVADFDIRALLLVGIYQLRSLRVPAHAAINETVEAAHGLKKSWAASLINGVLRRYQRETEAIEDKVMESELGRQNHPEWFIRKVQNNWPDHWQKIIDGNNDSDAPLTLRVNKQQISREDFLQALADEEIDATATPLSPQGVTLEEACDVTILPGYDDGWFSVQDEAAQLSAELLDLQPGQRVLDACAAPGGKLCHILEQEAALSHVDAVELEKRRTDRVYDNLARLKLEANLYIADASKDDWWDKQAYDRILLDAPCSATGVIRRHPDIKYLRKGEDIAALADIQLSILQNLWQMLAPGGKLLYATCSIFPQENERLIKRFVTQQNDAEHIPLNAEWGISRPYGRQLFAIPNSHDGFYYALLTKAVD
ncbi:MAG: 16S rRNA (cytosine(967)-C(5))-methyltransferase RsmB, partial [Oceanospirillaceae bacterium]|nr:16S rRNA (cytosine(967)-C(5))-methyltransferase RsmB [Oceanospirillaceae bacterium]